MSCATARPRFPGLLHGVRFRQRGGLMLMRMGHSGAETIAVKYFPGRNTCNNDREPTNSGPNDIGWKMNPQYVCLASGPLSVGGFLDAISLAP